jgi:hypothetical protein
MYSFAETNTSLTDMKEWSRKHKKQKGRSKTRKYQKKNKSPRKSLNE